MAMRTKKYISQKTPTLEDLINNNAEDKAVEMAQPKRTDPVMKVPEPKVVEEEEKQPRINQKKYLVYLESDLDRAFAQYQFEQKMQGNNIKFQRFTEGLLRKALKEYLK